MLLLLTNVDKESLETEFLMAICRQTIDEHSSKLLETEFLIAICRPTGDKWQSKTLFLAIFNLSLLIVKNIFDCRLPSVGMQFIQILSLQEKIL